MTDNKVLTGAIGERLVEEWLNETQAYDQVEKSSNTYDMHKDIAGVKENVKDKIEVKTRTVIRKFNAMPLEMNQWYKVDNCDRLIFVTNPTSEDEAIHIYEGKPDDPSVYTTLQAFGPRQTPTRMYHLDRMTKVKTIKDKATIQRLYELNVSSYKQ